jgi:hypothetical protein
MYGHCADGYCFSAFLLIRSCKWVTNVNVLPEPSMGPVQRQECMYPPRRMTSASADYTLRPDLYYPQQVGTL